MLRIAALAVAALFLVLALPGEAWAFGPATHVFLGQHLLDNLHLVSPAIAEILRRHPRSFLYGSIAADISLAKKYVPAGRHCHYWHVGEEIYAKGCEGDQEQLQAVGLGYLSHLAADTIAHNFFVPRQFVITSSTKALGHAYWEHRLDVQLGERYTALAREVIMNFDHSAADTLFDQVLSRTLFSFETNLRIFRGMIHVQDNDRWHSVFERLIEKSRWDLSDETIEKYMVTSFDYVVDYLTRRRTSMPAALDPVGEFNLHVSKQIRKMALKEGAKDKQRLIETADDFFPIPTELIGYWDRRSRT